jgi:anti-sigma B factor antagonist
MADLGLDVSFDDDAVVLRCSGELDVASVPKLDAVLDAVYEDGVRSIVVDLDGLRFMDSQGIAVLLRCWKHTSVRGKQLQVRNPRGTVATVLGITGLGRIVDIVPAPETAPA